MNGRLAAARRNSAWGTTQSALTGRCGPCCSVEPTAITTGASAAAAAAISGQGIHSYSTVPAPSTGLIRSSLTAASTLSISQIDTVSVCNFIVASINTTPWPGECIFDTLSTQLFIVPETTDTYFRNCPPHPTVSPGGANVRMYFCTDIHGSERCWKKFLATPKHYECDTIVIGGDITGKFI